MATLSRRDRALNAIKVHMEALQMLGMPCIFVYMLDNIRFYTSGDEQLQKRVIKKFRQISLWTCVLRSRTTSIITKCTFNHLLTTIKIIFYSYTYPQIV